MFSEIDHHVCSPFTLFKERKFKVHTINFNIWSVNQNNPLDLLYITFSILPAIVTFLCWISKFENFEKSF